MLILPSGSHDREHHCRRIKLRRRTIMNVSLLTSFCSPILMLILMITTSVYALDIASSSTMSSRGGKHITRNSITSIINMTRTHEIDDMMIVPRTINHKQQQQRSLISFKKSSLSFSRECITFCIPNVAIPRSIDSINGKTNDVNRNNNDELLSSSYVTMKIPRFLIRYYMSRGGKEGKCNQSTPTPINNLHPPSSSTTTSSNTNYLRQSKFVICQNVISCFSLILIFIFSLSHQCI